MFDDKIVITYYLCPHKGPHSNNPKDYGDVEVYTDEAAYEKAAFSFDISSTRLANIPPQGSQAHYWLIYKNHFALRLIYKK